MLDFTIIPLSERPELADICAAWSFSEWGCQIEGRTLEATMRGYRESLQGNGLPISWIAFCDRRPAGAIRLKKDDHPDRTDLNPWLGSLFVHPLFRKRGIAKALCLHLEDKAKNKYGFKKLYLFTPDAETLYEKIGWRRIGKIKDPMGLHKEEEVLMEKTL
jgi:GNAT superfamily N-acetyltransferase